MIDVTAETERHMDRADFDYLDAIRELGEEYDREGRAIQARYDAIAEECEAKMAAAKADRWNALRGLNTDYRGRAAGVASAHMARAAHPEDIEEAQKRMDAFIGGVCHDAVSFNADSARAAVYSAVTKRREREAHEAEQRKRDEAMARLIGGRLG